MTMNDTFSTYHPLLNFLFFIGAIVLGMCLTHPAYLAASAVLALCYLLSIKGAKAVKTAAAMAAVFVLVAAVNPLLNTRGSLVLFTWLNGRPYTLESLCYGMTAAGMLVSVLLWFACYNAVMTDDKFTYLFGSFAPSLSLILTMVLRLVPNYERQARRIGAARRCIGKAGASGGRRAKLTNGLTVLSALTSWALEGSIVTADSMRARGYGVGKRTNFSRYRFARRDGILVASMAALLVLVIVAAACGGARAVYLPQIAVTPIGRADSMIGLAAYGVFLAIPTVLNIKENLVWNSLRSNI
jgi:energy-coupling factor transport system permease protein